MDIVIKKGQFKQLEEIEQLYNETTEALENGVNFPGWKKGVYPTKQDAMEGLNGHNLFVATYQDKIVGSIILNHHPEKSYKQANWQFYGGYEEIFVIHTFLVHPRYCKLGVGKKLMDFAEDYGRRNQIKAIRLDVYENNTPAIKLYEHCGYRYIGTVDLGLKHYGLDWFKLFEKQL